MRVPVCVGVGGGGGGRGGGGGGGVCVCVRARACMKTFGERPFGYIAPTVWNSLPADLKASPRSQLSKLT